MESEKLDSLLIDYIDGALHETERAWVEKELSINPDAVARYQQLKEVVETIHNSAAWEPTPALKDGFEAMLKNEITSSNGRTLVSRPAFFYRVAAAVALLIVGGSIGFWLNSYHAQQLELAAIKEEMNATKHVLMAMLKDKQSASQRVQGANVAYRMEQPDDDIVNVLVNALNNDPNTNVRLAALDALSKFHSQPHVRKALIAALATQHDPVVQISLIRLMVDMKEKDVVRQLEDITNDNESIPAVKDEAHAGLLRLS